jgi:hypothetical protein
MTAVAQIKLPLVSVDRAPLGTVLGGTEGHINRIPVTVTMTDMEIHIGWADRNGPAFVIELNPLIKSAANEIEALLGMKRGRK